MDVPIKELRIETIAANHIRVWLPLPIKNIGKLKELHFIDTDTGKILMVITIPKKVARLWESHNYEDGIHLDLKTESATFNNEEGKKI